MRGSTDRRVRGGSRVSDPFDQDAWQREVILRNVEKDPYGA